MWPNQKFHRSSSGRERKLKMRRHIMEKHGHFNVSRETMLLDLQTYFYAWVPYFGYYTYFDYNHNSVAHLGFMVITLITILCFSPVMFYFLGIRNEGR